MPLVRAAAVDVAAERWPKALLLLDAVSGRQRGGTGTRVDWQRLRRSRGAGRSCWPVDSRRTTWPRRGDRAPVRRGRVVGRGGRARPEEPGQGVALPRRRARHSRGVRRGGSSDPPEGTDVKTEATQAPVFGRRDPDARGYFGEYGGRFVPETLVAPIEELTAGYLAARADARFQEELASLLATYVGRPTPLYETRRLAAEACGAPGVRILLKREDLTHTGAHKINNALGQALLARQMGKRRIVAETGAGQHGVATATACALLGLECHVYMGAEDMRRQALNVVRMRLLGASVDPGRLGQQDAQGRHQRGDARLGGERHRHRLPARLGAGAASVPADGARVPVGDRPRGAAPDARPGGPAAGRGGRLRRRRQQRHRHLRRLHRRSPACG